MADIAKLPQALREKVHSKGLDVAGEIMAEYQRGSIKEEGLMDTEQLIGSIVIKKYRGYVDVFPSGRRRNGERNETVGFVQEYGRKARVKKRYKKKDIKIGGMRATRWMSKTKESAEETIYEAITDIFNEVMEKHGF